MCKSASLRGAEPKGSTARQPVRDAGGGGQHVLDVGLRHFEAAGSPHKLFTGMVLARKILG